MFRHFTSRPSVLAFAIVLALVPAACTGKEGSPAASAGAGGEVPSGSITVVHAWAGAEGEAFQAVVDGFDEEYPDVTVELRQVPFDELNSQMIQQFSAGTPPDVVSTLPGLIHSLAAQDLLMPLDDLWDAWVDSGEYSEAFRTIASHEGTAYGVFFKGNINGLIWHRTDVMDDLGIEPPSDWAAFIDTVEQVQSGGELEPFAVGAADVWVPTQWSDAFLAKVAGPDKFNGLIDGSVSWDDPAVVDAFTQLSDFIQSYWPDDALDIGFTDANCAWATQGQAAFQNQGAFVNLTTPANCDESLDPENDFTFFEMPAPNPEFSDVHFVSGDLFSVAKDTDNPAAAKAFAAYLGSAEAQAIWAERGGFIAPNASTDPSVYPTTNDRKAAELFTSGTAVYDLDDAIGGEIQTVEREELVNLIQTGDVGAFIQAMMEVTERVRGG
ncbi:MAG TPA: extracellular solute-binding protein [candidate division Zixibacteria bacterium]|nr:extracellular solute-binding protein [candidate division Zixibacteria bacterium]